MLRVSAASEAGHLRVERRRMMRAAPKTELTVTPLVKPKIHQLLQNPIYYGEFYWLDQLHQGLHTPLISRDLFTQVQEVFARPIVRVRRSTNTRLPDV